MTEYALEIENLTKVYDNNFQALKGINLKIEKGDFFALLGHNGAGKSTTINIISSIISKTSGTIRVFGHDLDTDLANCKINLGVVAQDIIYDQNSNLLEGLIVQGGYYGIPFKEAKIRALYWLDKMNLLDKAQENIRHLSGGMARRYMIAKALMHNPRLLILDEPTAGIDVALRREMWNFLKEINELGITIILTTHYLEEAEYLCRNIAIIKQGEVKVNTSMKKLITSEEDDQYTLDISGYNGQELALEGVTFSLIDDSTLEILIKKSLSISKCFEYLDAQGINIESLRNSQNRLERIFMRYEEQGK
ncbi:ABC transporter ATP-binding protein [Psittacicella hinzii]|uniref:ABC transporter n=1 Tax=Psittacicella hinzii TaxID=2028575 RepID=A0A3A1YR66_9GAMM|nr:ABC transporter ATP-binding protein [Psittacicella hinzii]RIY38537.1 ABC transporter [Psittacicella hinzii]